MTPLTDRKPPWLDPDPPRRNVHADWLASLPVVRLEMAPDAVFSRVFINGEEWAASVKRISVDVEDGATICTLAFYAKVTAEGPLQIRPWPVIVENELDPDPLSVPESAPPRLPTDDGNPGTTIALVVLAAIVLLAVVGWMVAVPRP